MRRYTPLLAVLLVGCEPGTVAAVGVGGAALVGGFLASKDASAPTPAGKTGHSVGDPTSPFWYIGAGIGAFYYYAKRRKKE